MFLILCKMSPPSFHPSPLRHPSQLFRTLHHLWIVRCVMNFQQNPLVQMDFRVYPRTCLNNTVDLYVQNEPDRTTVLPGSTNLLRAYNASLLCSYRGRNTRFLRWLHQRLIACHDVSHGLIDRWNTYLEGKLDRICRVTSWSGGPKS